MKKFIRNLFSGFFLIILLLLIEIAAVIFVQFFVDDVIKLIVGTTGNIDVALIITLVYLLIRVIISIIAVIIFFKIVNKDEAPEFKVPWIVCMLLLPLFFSFLYLIIK